MTASSTTLGRIIMFDGPEGIGKTTQVDLTATALEEQGYSVFKTKTHGGSPIGEALRTVSLSQLDRTPLTDMYISLAMHSELATLMNQKRDAGTIVLVDRSPLSIIAYQAYGSGLDKDFIFGIVDIDMQLFKPDLLIVYRAPLDVSIERMRSRDEQNSAKKEYFKNKPHEYFERAFEGFAAAAARFNATVLDANDDAEKVHKRTMKTIKKILI